MKKLIFALILQSYILNAFADNFFCEPYHLKPSNTLGGISVFNARFLGDKYTAELAPTSENQALNVITQLWQLDAYRDTKLFVNCIYENNSTVTKEIPLSVNICKLTYSDQKADFICFNRGEKDGKYSPKA